MIMRFGALLCLASLSKAQQNAIEGLENSIQSIYQEHSNAVVRVKAATQRQSESGETSASLIVFSGFFISKEGKVLTNATPSHDSTRIWIEKDGMAFLADLIGTDESTNLSLLQVINLPKDFGYIEIDPELPEIAIGSFAFTITSPLDFGPSPAYGLVTGFESHFANIVFPFTYTRVSIPIGPAEGGSPVFDAKGKLIGISMASMPEVRSSYIIPPKALQRIVSDLSEYKSVRYGVLPLEFEEKADGFNQKAQVIVKTVAAGSPAEKADVQKGDVLISIDDSPIANLNQARDMLFFKSVGSFVHFKLQRDETELDFAFLMEPQADHLSDKSEAAKE